MLYQLLSEREEKTGPHYLLHNIYFGLKSVMIKAKFAINVKEISLPIIERPFNIVMSDSLSIAVKHKVNSRVAVICVAVKRH